jgi:hypothetical protein
MQCGGVDYVSLNSSALSFNSADNSKQINITVCGGTVTRGNRQIVIDYIAVSGTLTFSPGTTTRPINVKICSDTVNEADENFTVTLSNPVNATIAQGTGTATIVD